MSSDLETNIVAVEKVKEYSETPKEVKIKSTFIIFNLISDWTTYETYEYEFFWLGFSPPTEQINKILLLLAITYKC